MGFFKKVFGDAADELKKSLEESKNEMRKSLEDIKRSAMADFGIGTSSRKADDDDDDDEPRSSIPEKKEGKTAAPLPKKAEKNQVKSSSLTPPDKMEFEMFDESENETLFEHGFRFAQVPESGDVIYDIVNLEDSDLYLRKTNDNRYYRFYMYSPGELCVDKDFRAYSKVEHTEFDLAKYFKDYENDETEGDSEYDVDKKLFYGVEKNTKAPSQEYLPLDWEFVQFDEDENEYLGKHGFTYPRDTDVIYDIVGHDDYELFLVKTNNGRYFRFDPFGTGRLQIDADLNAYGIVEVTPFDFERFCKDYENDEVEDDLDEYEIEDKKAFYGCEQKVVIAEPAPEPEPIPEPMSEPQIATKSKVLPIDEKKYEIRDLKRKKMEDLRKARDEKDRNKTPENINRWKQVIADIQAIDKALKSGARTLDELKEMEKQNESLVAEINEFMGITVPQPDPNPEPVIVSEPVNSVYKGLFSERLEALISSALQDGVLNEQEKAVLKKRAEKDGEDWDEVEMIINSRLAEIQKAKSCTIL